MVQRMELLTFCDVEYAEQQLEVGAKVYVYPLLETGPTEVHLCDTHHKAVEEHMTLAQIREFLDSYGRPYTGEEPDQQLTKRGPKPGSGKGRPLTKGKFKCRWCKEVKETSQHRGIHERRFHPEEFEAAGGPKRKPAQSSL